MFLESLLMNVVQHSPLPVKMIKMFVETMQTLAQNRNMPLR
jgi:hypothetical protein